MPPRALLAAIAAFAGVVVGQDAPAKPIAGSIKIRLVVGTDGIPFHPEIVRGLTPEQDRLALESIRKWRFRPGMMRGKPIPVVATVEVNVDPNAAPTTVPRLQQSVSSPPSSEADRNGRALLAWYIHRAEQGDADSQVEAARRLSTKDSSEHDLVQACAWSMIAEQSGARQASKLRSKIVKRITSTQLSDATALAEHWKQGQSLIAASGQDGRAQ